MAVFSFDGTLLRSHNLDFAKPVRVSHVDGYLYVSYHAKRRASRSRLNSNNRAMCMSVAIESQAEAVRSAEMAEPYVGHAPSSVVFLPKPLINTTSGLASRAHYLHQAPNPANCPIRAG